jgi:hypothetical protein
VLPEQHRKYVQLIKTPTQRDPLTNGYTTAALRFTWDYQDIDYYDYVLITDIDMLHRKETPSLVDQRMMDLRVYGLGCYSNYVSSEDMGEDRMPGVHFVTKGWWEKTKAVRKKYQDQLLQSGADTWSCDERMIAKIVKECGLPKQKGELKLFMMHGVHLGDWRRRINAKEKHHPALGAHDQDQIKALLQDAAFMALVDECSEQIPTIKQTFDLFRKDIRL